VASRRIPGLAIVLGSATAAICVGGLINVAEVPFVTEELDGSDSAYSLLVALAGLGFIAGSLSGSSGGDRERKKRRYVAGLLLIGAGYLLAASSPVLIPALAAFMVAGFGNGLTLVYERQIVQEVVPDSLLGRVFGVRDALTAWAFAVAFLGSGVVLTLTGSREVILASGIGGLVTAAVIAFLFARHDAFSQVAPAEPTVEPRLGGSPETLGHGRVG
jgi:MFS family permease